MGDSFGSDDDNNDFGRGWTHDAPPANGGVQDDSNSQGSQVASQANVIDSCSWHH